MKTIAFIIATILSFGSSVFAKNDGKFKKPKQMTILDIIDKENEYGNDYEFYLELPNKVLKQKELSIIGCIESVSEISCSDRNGDSPLLLSATGRVQYITNNVYRINEFSDSQRNETTAVGISAICSTKVIAVLQDGNKTGYEVNNYSSDMIRESVINFGEWKKKIFKLPFENKYDYVKFDEPRVKMLVSKERIQEYIDSGEETGLEVMAEAKHKLESDLNSLTEAMPNCLHSKKE